MDTRKANVLAALILGIAAISATGCELIASVDRSEIKKAASSAGSGGTGGTGSSSSTSGSGGGGACSTAADCPATMNECVTATCTAGMCGTENVAADTPTATQTMADCKLEVCDGMGASMSVPDDADINDDSNSCTQDVCNMGTPENNLKPAGTMCTDGGGKVCSNTGTCVECNLSGECMGGICSGNQCVQINGCDYANAMDMTGMLNVAVAFGGMTGMAYNPNCLKVSQGTIITFNGNFNFHPLTGGEVVGTAMMPASSGPFVPSTTMGMSAMFTMSNTGAFPYYCEVHALMGMTGAVFVVP